MKNIYFGPEHPITLAVNAYGQWFNFPAKPGEFTEAQIKKFKEYQEEFGEDYDALEKSLYEEHCEREDHSSQDDWDYDDGSSSAESERHDWYLMDRRRM